MRKALVAISAAFVLAALALGRTDAAQRPLPAKLPSWLAGAAQEQLKNFDWSGRRPGASTHHSFPGPRRMRHDSLINLGINTLAVVDGDEDGVETFDTHGNFKNFISNRLACPTGDWYDAKGDLYVGDYCHRYVVEYNPGQVNAAWVYSAGLDDPINITTDSKGNVYVAGYLDGTVTEYAHRSNTVLHQCSPALGVEGITVDGQGNVYVLGNATIAGPGVLLKYTGGLGGCSSSFIGLVADFAGQMLFDKTGNLVVADQENGTDVLPPPFTSLLRVDFGFSSPFHIALNKQNNLLFSSENVYGDALVVTYVTDNLYADLYYPPYYAYGIATY
ncbi:MAG: SBBP repeat-containing protein [Candidatus Eremiobacteraeota bacterium]|nr:SBBP repeat-containing protein [Candidatus Eremiobacteraeota bacterium]